MDAAHQRRPHPVCCARKAGGRLGFLIYRTPRCSSRIFNPSRIRITPPASSAFALYFVPKTFPIYTPAADKRKVVTPIKETADITST